MRAPGHVAGALEERAFLDCRTGACRSAVTRARGWISMRSLARTEPFSEPLIETRSTSDLGVDLGRIAEDQLAARRNLALELSVDAEGLLEGQLALQVAALVEKAVERRAFAVVAFMATPPGFDVLTSHSRISPLEETDQFFFGSEPISICPPRRRRRSALSSEAAARAFPRRRG